MPRQTEQRQPSETPLAANDTLRTLALGEHVVSYALRYSRRRSIGLSIDHRGLRVGAPHRASLHEIESLIVRHGDWVLRKLAEWTTQPRFAPIQINDGVSLPWLGQTLQLRVGIGGNRALWNEHSPPVLTLCLRNPTDAPRTLERALRAKAHQFFSERLRLFSEKLGLPPPPLTLSSARTRWGSCSLKTGVRLNWRLIHFPPHIVDYVVVHELAHLREMNHGRRFWAIVAQHCPDYLATRKELNRLAAACPRW